MQNEDGERHAKSFIKPYDNGRQLDMDDMHRDQVYDLKKHERNRRRQQQLMDIQASLAQQKARKHIRKKPESDDSEDSISRSPPRERQSIPIMASPSNAESGSGFFSKLWSFIPFTCGGRNGQDYGYVSDEDQASYRQRKKQKQKRVRKKKKHGY